LARSVSWSSWPDPAPARRLREELQQHRTQGRPFKVAWALGLVVVLGELDDDERKSWRAVFANQERVWRANYSGPNVTAVLFVPEPESTSYSHARVVA
jgi:hypothetical protein